MTKLSMCMSPQFGRVWCIWNTVRKGLMHLDTTCHVVFVQCWLCVHLVGRKALHPQVQRLHLHVPWLHRRKRDCIPTLFLTSSVCTSTLSPCSSEEEGLAPLPSSSHCRGVLRRRRDRPSSSYCRSVPLRENDKPSSLTTTVTTSEEEGQALLLTMSVCSSEVRS